MSEEVRDLVAAANKARDILRQISLESRILGPISTKAQSVAWELTGALDALARKQPCPPPNAHRTIEAVTDNHAADIAEIDRLKATVELLRTRGKALTVAMIEGGNCSSESFQGLSYEYAALVDALEETEPKQ